MASTGFLLVGNGPYSNRGCEAIVRGTMAVLRQEFGNDIKVTVGSFGEPADISRQALGETDSAITHVCLSSQPAKRFSPKWMVRQVRKRLGVFSGPDFKMMEPFCHGVSTALEIGGDNYSLDYGLPIDFMNLDCYLHRRNIPVVIWGASVGPFDENPRFAPMIFKHLRGIRGILVRESVSRQYLAANGIDSNVFQVCDPAFVMEPVKPDESKLDFTIPEGTIGINFSPLMAKYATHGNIEEWVEQCSDIVLDIIRTTDRQVLLIPHVTSANNDDVSLLQAVAHRVHAKNGCRVICLDGRFSAAETKWLISRCAVFAGARTHATIAAFSTGTPVLSFSYSIKAKGLNQDILGTLDYCLSPKEITPSAVTRKITELLDLSDDIRQRLNERIPAIRQGAFESGKVLRRLME